MKDADGQGVIRAYVKGAPDQLLARASTALGPDGKSYPVDEVKAPYLAENEHLGAQGLRVLATAQRDFDPATFDPNADLLPLVADLELLALVGIVDPPRPEARDAIAKAHAAGIQVRMITGDHAVTAEAIARQLGSGPGDHRRRVLGDVRRRGRRRDRRHRGHRPGRARGQGPPGRDPARKGHIVAMTGDGVNDAPALKAADIGVAMGITGTEVSKEAAVMILTDDNFATIVSAVEQGRALYDNLMRYIRFQMASLFGFIATFLGASIFNILGGVPFLPLQTLWINFTVTVFQAVGLGYSKPRAGLMDEPPRPKDAQILPAAAVPVAGLHRPRLRGGHAAAHRLGDDAFDETVAHTMGLVDLLAVPRVLLARDRGRGADDLQQPAPREPDPAQGVRGSRCSRSSSPPTFGPLQRILDTTELTPSSGRSASCWPRSSSWSPRSASSCAGARLSRAAGGMSSGGLPAPAASAAA